MTILIADSRCIERSMLCLLVACCIITCMLGTLMLPALENITRNSFCVTHDAYDVSFYPCCLSNIKIE